MAAKKTDAEAEAVEMELEASVEIPVEATVETPVGEEVIQPFGDEKPGQFAYIGPSIPRGLLIKYAVFTGTRAEIEKYLSPVLEKYPKVSKLLVSVERLPESRKKAETPGNAYYKFYTELQAEFNS